MHPIHTKSPNKMGLLIVFSLTFLFQSILHLPIVAAKDTLFLGDELDSTSILLSPRGTFSMGFFTITTPTSYNLTITTPSSYNLTYLGIWYTNNQFKHSRDGMKIWVGNRDMPIVGYATTLKLDNSGTLRLINRSGATLFNVSNNDKFGSAGNNKKNTRAMLQDSGNFIVYDDLNRTIWESFDHPIDTIIPGMKLGYNLTTGQNWTLTASTANGFLASGAFTMRLENHQNSPQLLIRRHGELSWASGPWDERNRTFLLIQTYPDAYTWNVISDASGMYVTFQSSIFSLQLTPEGSFVDNDRNGYTPDFCYGYQKDIDNGCVISDALPYCRSAIASGFDGYKWETYYSDLGEANKTEDNSSISIGDCMEKCWKDCDCVACSTYPNGTGCLYWYEQNYIFLPDSYQVSVLSSNKDDNKHEKEKNNGWRWTLLSILFVPFFVLAYVRIKRRIIKGKETRKRDDFILQMTGSNSFNNGDELERGIKNSPDVTIFSLKAIMAATNNFSDENKLGQGGYGPVYKGKLSDGREIAVKRLSKSSGQGIPEFKSELILISKLQHTNLVRLYGCCLHQEEKMLIYEFMPNKSLDFFLFATTRDEKEKIDWQIRFNIIEGVAQGLLYLHKYSRMKVIHRDLKVGNILLDENMNPKIADFGMARIFQQNAIEAVTQRVAGTYGYMAPEYAMEGTFSIKSDVFSFGVLVLEIVSGRKNSSFYNPDRPLNLVTYAWELWKGHASLELKDETLGESYNVEQLLRVIHVGLLCVQDNADDRPTMSDVIYMLNNENIELPSPRKPAFFTGRQTTGFHLELPISLSEISLTVTTMVAR